MLPTNSTSQVTGASGGGSQPASPVRPSARTTSTAHRVNKGVAVVNGLLRLIPAAFFAAAAIFCAVHGVYAGLLMLVATAYYGWRSWRYFTA